jgi:hypothetical protein
MKHCSWCDASFDSDISYQIYCSAECRDLATKEKIAARYIIARRQKRKGRVRKCKQCEENLSIYNDDLLCYRCQINPSDVAKALRQIKGMTNDKSKRNR